MVMRARCARGFSAWRLVFGLMFSLSPMARDQSGGGAHGMLAEYAVLSEEALVHLPSHLSFEEAATLPCAAVTAWVALTGHRQVTAGDTVLTQGSGGVS